MKKDMLKLNDYSKEEILEILDLADELKSKNKNGVEHHLLKGKTLAMIFEKSSTRTRVSFETGMYQLGGNAMFLSSKDLQLGRGEPVKDTARVLERYVDGIMIRTYKQSYVEELAKYANIPIINGLTDDEHPCQVLADLMTIREYKKSFDGLKVCFIGDGNNMANTLMVGALKMDMDISIASPKGYQPKDFIMDGVKLIEAESKGKVTIIDSPIDAIKNADVVITDVWASMGQEGEQQERMKAFAGYQVNAETMSYAKPDAIVLHCLPAHREEEITAEILELHKDEIFEEAENRLHAQKALMVKLIGNK